VGGCGAAARRGRGAWDGPARAAGWQCASFRGGLVAVARSRGRAGAGGRGAGRAERAGRGLARSRGSWVEPGPENGTRAPIETIQPPAPARPPAPAGAGPPRARPATASRGRRGQEAARVGPGGLPSTRPRAVLAAAPALSRPGLQPRRPRRAAPRGRAAARGGGARDRSTGGQTRRVGGCRPAWRVLEGCRAVRGGRPIACARRGAAAAATKESGVEGLASVVQGLRRGRGGRGAGAGLGRRPTGRGRGAAAHRGVPCSPGAPPGKVVSRGRQVPCPTFRRGELRALIKRNSRIAGCGAAKRPSASGS
jgi:hypothetical protein